MRHITTVIAVLAALTFTGSTFAQTTVQFRVILDGSQQNPLTGSAGSGSALVTLTPATGAVTVTGTYTGLGSAANAAHIHRAVAGSTQAGLRSDWRPLSGDLLLVPYWQIDNV